MGKYNESEITMIDFENSMAVPNWYLEEKENTRRIRNKRIIVVAIGSTFLSFLSWFADKGVESLF